MAERRSAAVSDRGAEQRGARPLPNEDDIARRAYERFEARGREHGRDQEDWFEAERELNRQTTE